MAFPIFHDDFDNYESAITIRLQRFYTYDIYTGERKPSRLAGRPKSNKSNGETSEKAAKRIKQKIELLYSVAKTKTIYSKKKEKSFRYKVGFLTLTLPSMQIHSDNKIHETCFAPFIRAIRLKRPDFMYVWKAETQENGNLHYHVCTNSFLHKDYINDRWNYWVNKLSYVDNYGKDCPPSAKIQVCYGENGLASYMAKYMGKNDSRRRTVTIKTWDCSECLKAIKTSTIIEPEMMLELKEFKAIRLSEKNLRGEEIPMKIHMYKAEKIMKKQCPNVMSIWNNALIKIKEKASQEQSFWSV